MTFKERLIEKAEQINIKKEKLSYSSDKKLKM